MALYKLQMFFLDILDRLTFRRCKDCDEIIFDGECDYCDNSV
jgi:predicted DCC family thiol-disulfide oxidoreductase YuxK